MFVRDFTQCRENRYFSSMERIIRSEFRERFGKKPFLVAAPGRVNLIGEHTDYNNGFVLPGAVDRRIYVAIAENKTDKLRMYAGLYGEERCFSIDELKPVKGWATYLVGMMFLLRSRGKTFGGVDVWIDGDIPQGAGMSSSAALCSAFGFAVNQLFGLGMSGMELALAGQETEHRFAGLRCGIMDQFASLHGRAGNLMKLDCRSLDFEYIPFDFPAYRIVLINTMVSHSLASSEYNRRRQQCEEGVKILRKRDPGIQSLRDVTMDQLIAHRSEFPELVYRRCSFILQENERVLRGCAELEARNLPAFGQQMFASHEGLSKEYEVSCAESDFLVGLARSFPAVLGARQMGGGFGGCVICLVAEEAVEGFAGTMQNAYEQQFRIRPEVYITRIENGAQVIED
jgi:galactokinase